MQRTLKKIVIAIDENFMKLADRTILITGGVDEGVSKLMAYMKFVISLFLCAAVTCEAQTAPLPQILQNGAVKQFFVDVKPFIMLSGELHNSSASSIEYPPFFPAAGVLGFLRKRWTLWPVANGK